MLDVGCRVGEIRLRSSVARSGSFEAKERNNSNTYESGRQRESNGTGNVYFNTEY